MLVSDAVILMGGRAARLGGGVKGDLRLEGRTILERVVDAAVGSARNVVVVGEAGRSELPPEVRVVRESPPFAGPAAAIAAGVRVLGADASAEASDAVLLLAGDQPFAGEALPLLLSALDAAPAAGSATVDGVRAVDGEGRAQHLLSVVRSPALAAAIEALAAAGPLDGASMRQLLAPLKLVDVAVPAGAAIDVDTWADAHAIGATEGAGS